MGSPPHMSDGIGPFPLVPLTCTFERVPQVSMPFGVIRLSAVGLQNGLHRQLQKVSRSSRCFCLRRGRFAMRLLTSSKPQQWPEKQSLETLGIVFLMPQHAARKG